MNAIMDYLKLTLSGFENFIAGYKYLALIIGVLVYATANWRKYKNREVRKFLLYAVAMMLLLMIPVTGMAFLIYQTRFYDYEWAWSFIPLTAVLAWGIVTVVYAELPLKAEKTEARTEGRMRITARICGIAVAAAVLFVCGNQGRLQKISEEEQQLQYSGGNILQYMKTEDLLQGRNIWGPKDIMQYIRRHDGSVTLFYGRDMWDAKSGAYDYDVYDTEEIACYEWMEMVSSTHNLYLLEVEQAPEYIHEALAAEGYLREAVERDVDVIILPSQITQWMERKMQLIAEEKELTAAAVQVEGYTLWLLE